MNNLKSILFQFFAAILLIMGIKQFYIFIELDLLELITSLGKDNFAYFAEKSDKFGISNKLKRLIYFKIILGFIAVAINYLILFIIAYKKHLNWNISLGITIIVGVLHYFKFLEILPISIIKISLISAYIIPAIICIILSIICYLIAYKSSSNSKSVL